MEIKLLTIKEYAKKKNITYEAVRKQIQKYKDDELKDHIIKKNKTQYLDEYAVDFLDNRRRESPVLLYQMEKDEEIETLKRERENLLIKIAAQADKIAELSEWKADNSLAIAEAKQQVFLLEEKNRTIDALAEKAAELSADKTAAEQKVRDAESAAKEAADELASIKSKWWYKLFAKKGKTND